MSRSSAIDKVLTSHVNRGLLGFYDVAFDNPPNSESKEKPHQAPRYTFERHLPPVR